MEVTCLGASSKGNCYHIKFDKGSEVILDAGVTPKMLLDKGISMTDKLVLITHEHGDHIGFADEMKERYGARIGLSRGTEKFVKKADYIFTPNHLKEIDDLIIVPFTVIHNAENPVGYCVSDNNETLVYITDAGLAPPHVFDEVDVLIIEANYTSERIRSESLMAHLTGRTISEIGHLSVDQAFEYADYYLDKLDLLLLTHVSDKTFCHIEYHGSDKISKAFKQKAIIAEAGKEYLSLPF